MWNHNFDYVSEGNCTFIVVQQYSGSDRRQIEAAVMSFFFFAKKNPVNLHSKFAFSFHFNVCWNSSIFSGPIALCHVKVIFACTVLRKILAHPNDL